MKTLTKLWSNFNCVPFDSENIYVTKRHYLQRLKDPAKNSSDLFLSINTLSGAINIFTFQEGEILQALMDQRKVNVPTYLLYNLRKQGYLFPNKQLEEIKYNMLIRQMRNIAENSSKIMGYFSLDTRCSMGCTYCFQKQAAACLSNSIYEKATMSRESLVSSFKALDFIQELHQKEVSFVGGFGGEPLQEKHFDLNKFFLDQANERQHPVIYFSNLAMLGDGLKKLVSDRKEQIRVIATTLDGVGNAHDRLRTAKNPFEKTVETIDFFLKEGVKVMVRTNISPKNIENIPPLADFYARKEWFNYPNFRATISRVIDRKNQNSEIYSENEATSAWLALRDKYPLVKRFHNYKIAFTLFNLLEALKMREDIGDLDGGDKDSFALDIPPIISACSTDNGLSYTFTGNSANSIYACPVCSCFNEYRIGSHYPYITINEHSAKVWGGDFYLDAQRNVRSLNFCHNCVGATLCGGNCPFEAVMSNGMTSEPNCRNVDGIIREFLSSESVRLYKICVNLMA